MGRIWQPLVLWTVLVVMSGSSSSHRVDRPVPTANDYFHLNDHLEDVVWAHAVNSKHQLHEAIIDEDIMMLEADILMGTRKGKGSKKVPIMAHPPATTSDLTFHEFLSKVIRATRNGDKKGIKLDFKDMEAVEPVLNELHKNEHQINFPVWVNADIWEGPGNPSKKPVAANQFIEAVKTSSLKPTLSLGWTTRYGQDDKQEFIDKAEYTKNNTGEALKFLDDNRIGSEWEVTFPVRAGIAAQSVDDLVDLVIRAGSRASLTLWSSKEDPVNKTMLRRLIANLGGGKVYVDLPFSVDDDGEDTKPHPNDNKPDSNPTSTTTSTSTPKPTSSSSSQQPSTPSSTSTVSPHPRARDASKDKKSDKDKDAQSNQDSNHGGDSDKENKHEIPPKKPEHGRLIVVDDKTAHPGNSTVNGTSQFSFSIINIAILLAFSFYIFVSS